MSEVQPVLFQPAPARVLHPSSTFVALMPTRGTRLYTCHHLDLPVWSGCSPDDSASSAATPCPLWGVAHGPQPALLPPPPARRSLLGP